MFSHRSPAFYFATAKIKTGDKRELVFFSIPYEDGWTATVNGKYLHIVRVKNTVLYAEVSEDNMNSVQTIVNKIKY